MDWLPYREIWCIDFEFHAPSGSRPEPICLVAREVKSSRTLRLWGEEMRPGEPPFHLGPENLFVAHYASAEWGCFMALGWPMPERVFDTFAEFKCRFNGLAGHPAKAGLLDCLDYLWIQGGTQAQKDLGRDLAMRGGPYTVAERKTLLDYCESDVVPLPKLFGTLYGMMESEADLAHALIRGRYTIAAARMEWAGVPIDTARLEDLRDYWPLIVGRLIEEVDRGYGVYNGASFNEAKFESWLRRHKIPWPRHDSGRLRLDDDTFRDRGKAVPEVEPLRQLRVTLGQLRLNKLAVGPDGRNRTLLGMFGAKTGRNAPSTAKFVFGPARWIRRLITPEPGRALLYCDFGNQEMAIAACLSGDPALWHSYATGDPYMDFGKRAGMIPPDGTKHSHKRERQICKALVLGTGYGMQAPSLALGAGIYVDRARELLQRHREAYPVFWRWAERNVTTAQTGFPLSTPFGWRIHVRGEDASGTTFLNWPMQSSGADMMRIAACLLTEAGLEVHAPIHDAFLVGCAEHEVDTTVAQVRDLMEQASTLVLGDGRTCRVDADVLLPGQRMGDTDDPEDMWNVVVRLMEEVRHGED